MKPLIGLSVRTEDPMSRVAEMAKTAACTAIDKLDTTVCSVGTVGKIASSRVLGFLCKRATNLAKQQQLQKKLRNPDSEEVVEAHFVDTAPHEDPFRRRDFREE